MLINTVILCYPREKNKGYEDLVLKLPAARSTSCLEVIDTYMLHNIANIGIRSIW